MGKFETTMSGTAIESTLKQMSMIGDIGKEILQEFGINRINSKREYSYKVRGAIQSAAKERFGKEALFFYGLTMLDSYKKMLEKSGGSKSYQFLKNNADKLDSNNLTTARKSRNEFVEAVKIENTMLTKGSIFTPEEDIVGAEIKLISNDIIEYTLTNAVLLENEYFNRGILIDSLSPLMRNWKIDIKFMKSKVKVGKTGWCKFVWNLHFKRQKSNRLIKLISEELKEEAKQKFIQNVLQDANIQRKKSDILTNQLSKYIPPQIHKAMMRGDYDTDIATKRKKLTVFFSDIKNFTETSESLQPEDLTKYLNQYFSEMTRIALEHGATIDKYIGDAVMLFFGDPTSKGEREDARSCVEMALKMQEKMIELRENWRNIGFANPFEIRIGINTGYCNVGNFGSDQRLTYTIIGGEVNVAARLESAGDAGGILMSYETYANAKDMIEVEEKKSIKMKGINREIKVYSVLGRNKIKLRDKSLNNTTLNKDIDSNKTVQNNDTNEITELKNIVVNLKSEVSEIKESLKRLTNK